ncbi:hypothetical protein V7968_11410 [Nocardia vulneris]|uniref:hypothetical protein n=1 Tax=Nocardia vulneris TaxID=1141657 RepID=UPI0030CF891E
MGVGAAGADPIPLETPAAVPEADVIVGGSCLPTGESVLPCLINSLSSGVVRP